GTRRSAGLTARGAVAIFGVAAAHSPANGTMAARVMTAPGLAAVRTTTMRIVPAALLTAHRAQAVCLMVTTHFHFLCGSSHGARPLVLPLQVVSLRHDARHPRPFLVFPGRKGNPAGMHARSRDAAFPSGKNHLLDASPRTRQRGGRRIAEAEGHERLAARLAEKIRERVAEPGRDPEAAFAVGALGQLIERLH